MFGSAISRWTMLHFEAALSFFLLAQLAMVAGLAFPTAPLFAPITLATVHLLTIGWLTLLMLGALHQFIPVLTAQGSVAGISALISLVTIIIGLGGMEIGFVALDGRLAPSDVILLPIGGVLVLTGVTIAAGSLFRTLWQTRPLPFAARFVAAGLVFLFTALGLGILLGCALSSPELVSWTGAFTDGLRLHLLAGLIGWFTLTAMGVSYRLLSMFTLAPEERGLVGTGVLVLSVGGLTTTWLLDLAAALGAAIPNQFLAIAAAVTGLGIMLYLFDMARLYRARRRHKLELNTGMAFGALAALGISIFFAFYLYATSASEKHIGVLGYLFLFGWLSGLALSQLYKIVPFMTWLDRYGSILGKQVVPRVQDLVDERRDRPWFILYFAAVAAGTLFAALGWPIAWRLAALGHLMATLMIARALWLVRYGTARRIRPAAPSASPQSNSLSQFAMHQ